MIMWNRLDPKITLVEFLTGKPSEKTAVTLEGALDSYSKAEGIHYKFGTKLWCTKILTVLDGKKLITSFTIKDANHVFDVFKKKENEATSYRIRATLSNSIRYSLTGQLPEPKGPSQTQTNPNGTPETNGDIGKLKFSVANLAEVTHLIPLYTTTGRFGWVKAEVQKMIYSLGQGQAGMIEAPKRSMTPKEGKAMCSAVTAMFTKGKLPWAIRYNPNECTFIVLRQADMDKLVTNNKKGA